LFTFNKSLYDTKSQTLVTAAQTRAENISTIIIDQKQETIDIAGASIFRDVLTEKQNNTFLTKAESRLIRTVASNPNLIEIYIVDSFGKVLLTTDKEEVGLDKSAEDIFTKAKTGVYIDKTILYGDEDEEKEPTYALSAPVTNEAGNFLGVIVIRYNINKLTDILTSRIPLGDTSDIFVLNNEFYPITQPRYLGEDSVLTKKIDTPNSRACFDLTEMNKLSSLPFGKRYADNYVKDLDIIKNKDYRGVDVIGTHMYIPEINSCLIAKIDAKELNSVGVSVATTLLIVLVSGMVILAGLIYLLSGKISSPIEKLKQGVRIIQSGNLDYKIGNIDTSEIGDLAKAFDEATSAIKASKEDLDKKVVEQTFEIKTKNEDLKSQQRAVLNILQDVQEQENTATIEKTKYESLLGSIGEGIIVTDSNLNILLTNPIAEKILGFAKEEVIGKKFLEVIKVVDQTGNSIPQANRPIAKALSDRKPFNITVSNNYYYLTKTGSKVPVSLNVSPVLINGNVFGVINVFRDISHEKDVDRMKTEFISLASHQLRTPLSAMKWFLEMLINGDAGALNKEQGEFVKNVADSNERMIALVNGLLNISRIESGRLIVDPKPTNMNDLVKNVLTEIKQRAAAKNIKLIVSVHENISQINIDPKLIGEVFINLITNAVKYTPEGGEVSIIVSENDKEIISSVSDTGYGIPVADQPKIFERFYRASNAVKNEPDGTGLGLYLAKAIMDSSGGRIWFKSEEGKGSTFWFSIPRSGMIAKKGEVGINE